MDTCPTCKKVLETKQSNFLKAIVIKTCPDNHYQKEFHPALESYIESNLHQLLPPFLIIIFRVYLSMLYGTHHIFPVLIHIFLRQFKKQAPIIGACFNGQSFLFLFNPKFNGIFILFCFQQGVTGIFRPSWEIIQGTSVSNLELYYLSTI